MRQQIFALSLFFLSMSLQGCTETPDPCAGYPRACIGVTVENGPSSTYQLLVRVLDGYGSVTPVTPRKLPKLPLQYPLRFAIRFDEFDRQHKGMITFEITALDSVGDTLGQVQRGVAINYTEKTAVSLSIGPVFDMAAPEDLRPPVDLATPDLSPIDGMPGDGPKPDGGPI